MQERGAVVEKNRVIQSMKNEMDLIKCKLKEVFN